MEMAVSKIFIRLTDIITRFFIFCNMIKTVFAILLLVLNCSYARSQRNKHFFITLDQGLSLPVGKFKSKEYSPGMEEFKEVNGLAKAGYQFGVSAGYQFNKTFGVMIQLGESFNKQDEESFEEYFRDNFFNNYDYKAKSKHWAIFKGLGGIVMHSDLGVKKQFFIEGKLLGGICKTKVPGFEISGYGIDPASGITTSFYGKMRKMDIPSAFCWQVSSGLGYRTKSKLYFLFDVNYFNSKSTSKFSYTPYIPPGPPLPPVNATYEYNLNSIGINATIGVEL